MRNKDFRRDVFIQETTAEIQLRYEWLYNNRFEGKKLKEDLGKNGGGVAAGAEVHARHVPPAHLPGAVRPRRQTTACR